MSNNFTILVNSSDGFEDCWTPFFTLFSKYWPGYTGQIFLNTETKDWSFTKLDIKCTKIQESYPGHKLTWSECLIGALNKIETPLVLYFQEDYFLEKMVDTELINLFAERMLDNEEIKHIGLTHFGSQGPFENTNDSHLWKIRQNARYRISTQVGLWRVEALKSYLRASENGWMFEIYGSRRARRINELFLTANRDLYNPDSAPIVQYTHTGIIKGKWHPAMKKLFSLHGLDVDFKKRGFYKPKPKILEKLVTIRKVLSSPRYWINGFRGL